MLQIPQGILELLANQILVSDQPQWTEQFVIPAQSLFAWVDHIDGGWRSGSRGYGRTQHAQHEAVGMRKTVAQENDPFR